MTTYTGTKNGKTYSVEAGSPEEGKKLLKEAASKGEVEVNKNYLTAPDSAMRPLENIGVGLATGINKGAASLPGLPGALEMLGRWGINKMGGGVSPEPYLPTPTDTMAAWEGAAGDLPKAQNKLEEYSQSVGEFIPAMAAAGGGVLGKLASSVGGGAGAQAGKDVGGTPGAVIGGLLGSLAPAGIAKFLGRGGAVPAALEEAGLTAGQARNLPPGALPADISERSAGLLEKAMKYSSEPETARRVFTDRPVRETASDAIAAAIEPRASSVESLAKLADDGFNAFRAGGDVVVTPAMRRLLEKNIAVQQAVKRAGKNMTDVDSSKWLTDPTLPANIAEDIRNQLTGAANASANAADKRKLTELASDFASAANRPDWDDAITLSWRSNAAKEAASKIGSVMDPSLSPADLAKKVASMTESGTGPTPGLMDVIKQSGRAARTSDAAGARRVLPDLEEMPTGVGKLVAGTAAKAVSPIGGGSAIITGTENLMSYLAKKVGLGGMSEKNANSIVKALSDPNHPAWDKIGQKTSLNIPTKALATGVAANANATEIIPVKGGYLVNGKFVPKKKAN